MSTYTYFSNIFENGKKTSTVLKDVDLEAMLETILGSSWATLEAFGSHFGHLGANLSQHGAPGAPMDGPNRL